MARKSSKREPPERAMLSANQIRAAIPKIQRRLRELEQVEISEWNDDIRNALDALQSKVEDTLVEVFGPDTLEYNRFKVIRFSSKVPISMHGTSGQQWMDGYREAVAEAVTKLRTATDILQEKLEDMGETSEGLALQAFQGLDLHPEIDRAVGDLYRNGHYANAIEDAVKALNSFVRLRSGIENIDGTKLIEHVFSPNKPVLRFNQLTDDSDRSEQLGYMMMFSGAVAGLRNPRAHKLIQDDPERALEFIAFISLLAKLLDGAEKVVPEKQ